MHNVLTFLRTNLLTIAVLAIITGMALMAIGSGNPVNRFGFRHVTLAPVVLLAGYALVVISILKTNFD